MTGKREPLATNPAHERRRVFWAAAFAVVAFFSIFLGFLILATIFIALGEDAVQWFRKMPGLVEEKNEKIRVQVAKAKQISVMIDEKRAELRQEMDDALAMAASDDEKANIRKLYEEKVIPSTLVDLELTRKEFLKDEDSIRDDTSAPALLAYFLTHGPSNEPQDAGISPALLGSLYLGIITLVFAVPLGVGAAIYLEEYNRTGWISQIIRVNISNLAGIPSVVYGILGAFVFVHLIFLPLENSMGSDVVAARNLLGGGLTLALLTLPLVIVSTQEALRAVPDSIRQGALALGATRWQVIWRLVLTSARPGILTGTILALSRAMGEAAALVLFGALLFVSQNPSLLSRFTVVPMQIFGWTDRPVEAWKYNAAMGCIVLLIILLVLNGTAIYLRQRAMRALGR